MELVKSAPSIKFRSKKPAIHATPKKPAKLLLENQAAMVETPEKSMRPPRVRNQNMTLSIGDVKRTAQMLLKRDLNRSDLDSDPLGSFQSGSISRMAGVEKHQRGAVKGVERSVDLPEKYLMLCEFFNVIVSVIPLLRMRRKSSTFTNICPKIQSITDRRFTINHLAQLKYILPEVILVKRIRVRDEQTDCMKEELLITLDMEAVKASKNMKKIFQGRVEDYYQTHIEESDIPEGELPALFWQPNQNEASSIDKSSCVAAASHVSRLFQRSFSLHVSSEKSEKQTTQAWLGKSQLSESSNLSKVLATPIKDSSAVPKDGSFTSDLSKETSSSVMKDDCGGVVDIQGTPAKEALTPLRLMDTVPAIKPSKRCHVSSGDDDTCDIPTKLACRPNRTLKFEVPVDSAVAEVEMDDALGSNINCEIIDLLPKNLLLSVRENERKILKEQDPAISQARRRRQLMSGLPKLFDMIHLLFHSINRSAMTKEELIYKLITSHCDIIDRGELEEQFKLLQELAPEYIFERMCLSGDSLVLLNKSVSVESVHAKLQES